MRNHNFIIKLEQTVFLFFMILFSVSGQEIIPEDNNYNSKYSVQWVSQFPAIRSRLETGQNGKVIAGIFQEQGNNLSVPEDNKNWFTNLILGRKSASLIKPMSVVAINRGSFWIADQGGGSILQVEKGAGETIRFRKSKYESFPSLVGSCLVADGGILFTDSKLNKIFHFAPGDKNLHILNDALLLNQPTGIAYSSFNREIWIVETMAHRITVLSESGDFIRHIGHRGTASGEFNFPTYIWIDKSGTAYIVDAMNFRIQLFDSKGNFLSEFGEIGDASGYFARPKGIATDSFGHIYITDALFNNVQIFSRDGKLLYVFGSKGKEKEQFWMPTGIFIDKNNFIYVADSYNSRIQIFQLIIS